MASPSARSSSSCGLPRDVRPRLYVIFRPHNVYGELQNIGDRYRNVLGIFINQIMRGEPLSIFGDGTQTRAFSYVGDVAPADRRAPDVDRRPRARSSTSAPTSPGR